MLAKSLASGSLWRIEIQVAISKLIQPVSARSLLIVLEADHVAIGGGLADRSEAIHRCMNSIVIRLRVFDDGLARIVFRSH